MINAFLSNFRINLIPLDQTFLKTIPDNKQILIKKEGVYHTILVNGEKAGIVGFIPTQNSRGEKLYFIQIALLENFRGKGLTKIAEDLIASKYTLPKLYATIEIDNLASLKTHLKAGFEELDKQSLAVLRQNRFLKVNQTRLFKEYSTKKLSCPNRVSQSAHS
jgi:RimJ/RimL family protein N-acetyltransferase